MSWSPRYFPKINIDIKTILRIIGAADAAANLLWEFSIAAKKDDKLTNIKNGNVILVKSMAKSIFFWSSIKPGAIKLTKAGIKISIIIVKNSKPKNKRLNMSFANFFDFDFFLTSSDA